MVVMMMMVFAIAGTGVAGIDGRLGRRGSGGVCFRCGMSMATAAGGVDSRDSGGFGMGMMGSLRWRLLMRVRYRH